MVVRSAHWLVRGAVRHDPLHHDGRLHDVDRHVSLEPSDALAVLDDPDLDRERLVVWARAHESLRGAVAREWPRRLSAFVAVLPALAAA